MPANPATGVRAPKAARGLPKALSVEQAQALLDRAPPESADAMALRDHAMFELFYSSGLRLSELIGLDVRYARENGYESRGWLDMEAGEVHVLGKGGKRRSVPAGAAALAAVSAWLQARAQWAPAD